MRYIFEFLFFCTQISSQMFKYNISEYVFQIPNSKALRRHSENMSWPGIVLKTIRSERIKIILSALQNSERKKLYSYIFDHEILNSQDLDIIPAFTFWKKRKACL